MRKPNSTLVALAAAAAFALPAAGLAQTATPDITKPVQPAVTPAKLTPKAEPTPPPALPGAQSSADEVAPAMQNAGDLSPTAALFDAVNRCDLPAARDAVNRGADLGGHNELGQTPLDLSIDLNRNDITFLLLSMRDENGAMPQGPGDAAKAALAARAARGGATFPAARLREARAVVTPKPVAQPRLFANDGGRADPSVGFLGFAPTR